MSEERRIILNMLAEQKITAEEAAELLQALGPVTAVAAGEGAAAEESQVWSPAPAGPDAAGGAGSPPWPERTKRPERAHGADGGDAAGQSRSILEEFLSRLDIDWGNLPFAFGGEAYRFEEEHGGSFEAGNETVTLDLTARNGRVEVSAWDRPEWRAVVRKKVRGTSEEQARQRGQEIAFLKAGAAALTFEERSVGWGNTGVSIEVWVPKDRTYKVNARSSNGRVVLDGLRCAGLVAKTANGKVGVRILDAADAEVATANGQVVFEGAAGKLNCHTANGSIKIYPQPGNEMRVQAHTANGSIKVWVPQDRSVGCEVEARTGFGGLEVDLPEFTVLEQDRQFGRRLLRGHSVGFAGKERKLHLTARTTNGSVRVISRRAGDGEVWEDDDRPGRNHDASTGVQGEPGPGGGPEPREHDNRAK